MQGTIFDGYTREFNFRVKVLRSRLGHEPSRDRIEKISAEVWYRVTGSGSALVRPYHLLRSSDKDQVDQDLKQRCSA